MKNQIRVYRNTVSLNFDHCGDNFTLKVPHYNKWLSIIRFLRKRGFTIRENPSYKLHYNCLSKFHKLGCKNDVRCLMEINASSITVEFGNVKNLWRGIAQSFWSSPSDERTAKLNYLESITIKLEIKKLFEHAVKIGMEFVPGDEELKPEDYIIKNLQINKHIHGDVKCLNDIKISIKEDSYNYKCNSNDKNKKRIICGETKYFYDYNTKRLSRGVVWHHINNMWWVICNNTLRNVASFDLFDFDPALPKRKKPSQHYIEQLLTTFSKAKNYKKCDSIQRFHKLQELTPSK